MLDKYKEIIFISKRFLQGVFINLIIRRRVLEVIGRLTTPAKKGTGKSNQ